MLRVVKVGGSLLDWGELPSELRRWLANQPSAVNVLICGGGVFADGVRAASELYHFDDELGHWLSIDCLAITAKILARLMTCPMVQTFGELAALIQSESSGTYVFDPRDWLLDFEGLLPGNILPRDWSATSDSIAARVAGLLEADELVLLKSGDAENTDLEYLAGTGFVDKHFAVAAGELRQLRMVNLRGPAAIEGSAPPPQ